MPQPRTSIKLTAPPADDLDARKFREMVESEAFGRFRDRIQAELNRAVAACTRADSDMEVRRAQGATMALQAALALPAQILQDLAKKTA